MSIPTCSLGWWRSLSSVIRVPSSDPAFAWRLALFVALGVQLPFLPLWFAARGLDAGAIGLVLALPMVVRVVAIPLATRSADRHDALRLAIVVAAVATVLGYGALALAQGALAIALVFALASVAYTPIMPLTDSYALRGLGRLGRAYGPVRLWGSAAFIVGSFIAGFATDLIPARHLIWLIVAASAITAAAALALEPVQTSASATEPPPRRGLLRDPAFIAVMAAASLIQASHAVYYGFSALQWRAAGLDGTTIAALWALGVIAEIVLFAVQSRLPPFLSPPVLLLIGALGGAVRWSAMALDPPVALLPALQLLHAATFGATHLGMIGFVAANAPRGQGATAQGYLAVALGTTMAGATALSGVLYGAFGGRAYAAMALAAVAGGVAAYIAHRVTRRVAAV